MDWSRAKTIFIITFLILDIFLITQVVKQKDENTFDLMKETSIDEQLKADEITFPELPVDPTKENYVEANIKSFSNKELSSLPSQEITISNETYIQSVLSKPFVLKKDFTVKDVDQFVQTYIYNGNQYAYWNFDVEKQTITYYQTYEDKTFYQNASGKVVLYLNDKDEITSYTQTMLVDIQEIKEEEIITAYEALVILYNRHLFQPGSEITDVDLGYYTLVPDMTSQLLAPTWRFSINGQDDLFVNAVEGHVFQVSNEEGQVIE
ncbi:two-component system regulatory protein YycI [Caldibacillus lycopersici]|uniref:Two-component system regulatory protein YycI n=1 Tax=Perspicuibacillus lycopersici TaxID=1325689 RepID=A0AAE3IU37_9BACI|nr:two-component system regulatory protein YycI [Perspicuibacillus lycopersici]MCU9613459.1 two-component system regulatory protein YycI [Perspicuibacillus lycopersici]